MFTSLTVVALFIAIVYLERSFLDRVMEADLNSPHDQWSGHHGSASSEVMPPKAFSQDS